MNPKLTISHLKMGDYHSFLAIYSFQNAEIRTLLGGGNSSRGHGKRKSTLKLLTNILLDDRHSKSKSNDPTRGC